MKTLRFQPTLLAGTLAMIASFAAHGHAQVERIADINARAPTDVLSGKPREMTRVGSDLYFVAESRDGTQLWTTRGGTTTTRAVPGLGSAAGPTKLTAFGSKLWQWPRALGRGRHKPPLPNRGCRTG